MKDLSLLVWLTQLGINVVAPLAGCILLALWLRNGLGWGDWALWSGIVLGVVGAIDGLRSTMKILEKLAKDRKKTDPPAVSFNDHD